MSIAVRYKNDVPEFCKNSILTTSPGEIVPICVTGYSPEVSKPIALIVSVLTILLFIDSLILLLPVAFSEVFGTTKA